MTDTLPKVDIHTDGAFFPHNGNVGGWAAILVRGETPNETSETIDGREAQGINNERMELMAVVCALESLKKEAHIVTIYTDYQNLSNIIEAYLDPSMRRSLRSRQMDGLGKDGKPRVNRDLFERLFKALDIHTVSAEWVHGHREENDWNERAHCAAVAAASAIESPAFAGSPPGRGDGVIR